MNIESVGTDKGVKKSTYAEIVKESATGNEGTGVSTRGDVTTEICWACYQSRLAKFTAVECQARRALRLRRGEDDEREDGGGESRELHCRGYTANVSAAVQTPMRITESSPSL
jgi:hypothetical protein